MYISGSSDINAIEARLWKSADTLRANSGLASNEYFLPVMGLIFLRHAYQRFLDAKAEIEKDLPKRSGVVRELTKEDFSQRTAIYLRPHAQYDYLVSLPGDKNIHKAIEEAMDSIESDYSNLKGILPKDGYREIPQDILRTLLTQLNPEELKHASGDVFGRIYEYFLTGFANAKAHDNGEFYTPVSLVSFLANVLEPKEGIVLDPACGSGGMFVQSAHFLEQRKQDPTKKLIFKGIEKNEVTTRLGKMNLAVHGLEGDIRKGITYYDDPHDLTGKASYVMANPPFNVDEIDADKIKNDKRLKFGLPGVTDGKVQNGNYVWISYFYSYLKDDGRAGFVMSSQASSAGGEQAQVREKLIKTGDVDAMVAIRGGFFYTRTVPCELWFFDRSKPKEHKDKVLMLDARNVYRKVTRTVNDFSPEQLKNLLSVIWLYRGEHNRFIELVEEHAEHMLENAECTMRYPQEDGTTVDLLDGYPAAMSAWVEKMRQFVEEQKEDGSHTDVLKELTAAVNTFNTDLNRFEVEYKKHAEAWKNHASNIKAIKKYVEETMAFADLSRDLAKQTDLIYRHASKLKDICVKELGVKTATSWNNPEITKLAKAADVLREELSEQLKLVRYFHKHAEWLVERFPEAKLRDVEGLVKLVDHKELAKNDWSLTPGRYVGVAPEEEDEDFDFEESLRELHVELEGLNQESVELAEKIKKNFEGLGI